VNGPREEGAQRNSKTTARSPAKISPETAPTAAPHKSSFSASFFRVAQLLSYVAVVAALPAAIYQIKNFRDESARAAKTEQEDARKEREEAASAQQFQREQARKDELEEAHRVYREVNSEFSDFMKLCFASPQLDCYSVTLGPRQERRLTPKEKVQQKILYTELTELFEVVYVNYKPSFKDIQEDADVLKFDQEQWLGWDAYIHKFLARPAYCQVFLQIRDEYDPDLVSYMNTIAPCVHKVPGHRHR
jgi:hypothetical protein